MHHGQVVTASNVLGTSAGAIPRAVAGNGEAAAAAGGPARRGPLIRGGIKPAPSTSQDQNRQQERKRRQRYYRDNGAAKLINGPVERCGRFAGYGWEVNGQKAVAVRKGKSGAFLGNVVTCGSVHHCPVCSFKIATLRCAEVALAVSKHHARGGTVAMVTLTQGHKDRATLVEAVERRNKRWTEILDSTAAKRRLKSKEILGYCVSREATHGDYGWHPHLHALIFFEPGVTARQMADYWVWLSDRWVADCIRDGDGADLQAQNWTLASTADAAGSYVTKFGIEWELTHSNLKSGRGSSRSPFQLLKDFVDEGDEKAGELFAEYATAMKGKRQLTWPGGVDKFYGIKDADDADALHDDEQEAEIVAFYDAETQRRIDALKLQDLIESAVDCSGFLGLQAVFHNYHLGNLWPPEKGTRWRPIGGFGKRPTTSTQETETC